jgi:hypothetical protein
MKVLFCNELCKSYLNWMYTTTCKYLSPLLERENENVMPYAIDSFDSGAYFLF